MSITKVNPLKLALQLEAIEVFKAKGFKGTFELPPGLGKSYLAVLLMKDLLQKHPDSRICIVVPSERLYYQWRRDYINDLEEEFPEAFIELLIINTAIKVEERVEYRLVIYDEIHEYLLGEEFVTVFNKRYSPNRAGLSGSLDDERKRVLYRLNMPVVFSKTRSEALQEGLLTPTYVYWLPLDLGIVDSKRVLDLRKKIHAEINKLPGHYINYLNARNKCVQEHAQFMGWTPNQVVGIAYKIQRLDQERNRIIGNHPAKLQVYHEVVNKFRNKQIITFSGRTEQADLYTSLYPNHAVSYHSKLKGEIYSPDNLFLGYKEIRSQRKKVGNKFKTQSRSVYLVDEEEYTKAGLKQKFGKIKVITEEKIKERNYLQFIKGERKIINSVSALERGIDISNLDVACELSRDASQLSYIQRVGRLRASGGIYLRCFMRLLGGKISNDEKKVRQSQGSEPYTEIRNVNQINL